MNTCGILTRKQKVLEKRDEISELYKFKVPVKDICLLYEMGKSAVNSAIRKSGTPRDRHPDPEELSIRNKSIIKKYKKEVPILEIAETFDLSESSIDRILRENNIVRNRNW